MSTPRSIELLSRIAPVSDGEAAALFGDTRRERLLEDVLRLSPRARPARRRLRRPRLIAMAALVAVAATGATWALTRGQAGETTSIECVIQGGDTIIDATSGDPAADCAAAWQGVAGAPPPPLAAYDNGLGGVTVIPRSQTPPAGWKPLQSQAVALIELQEALDDQLAGLSSTCFDSSAATAFAERELARLSLVGWTVEVRSGSPGACYGAFADPITKTVTLLSAGAATHAATWPPRRLATGLRPLKRRCLSLPAMRAEVEQRATSLGFSQTAGDEHSYRLSQARDDTLRCTKLYETVSGAINLILRGPAAP
ncbi:MAG: hypothetical protein ACJ75G_09780 [Gaiellaceae bacterium]